MCRELLYLFVGCLMLGVVLTSATRADLVGWWMFDEGSETVAVDSSINGNDGTLQGNPQWVAGKLGGALEGDGNGDYVRVPHSESLNISDAVTISMWLSGGIPPDQPMCKASGGNAWQSGMAIRLDDNPSRVIDFRGRTSRAVGLNSVSTVPTDEWYHVAATFDLNAPGDNQKIYINGVLDAQKRVEAPLLTNTDDLLIGADAYGTTRWHWQGMIDDVRIYNQALLEGQIQAVMQGAGVEYPFASRPSPADGAVHEETWVTLSWSSGDFAVLHDVYFGENYDEVNAGTGGTFQGNQLSNDFTAGLPGCPYPDGLVPGTNYYWRIDEVQADGVTRHRGDVWNFFVLSGKAYDPYPGEGERFIDTDVTLTWAAGKDAQMHTVYFGEDFDAVEDAAGVTHQMLNYYYPGELEFGKTYYWRVDEFDGATTHIGDIWSFTTMSEEAFWAAAYYVDGGNRVANDGNPGTEVRPFKTIERGVQSLQPGDTLLIKAGTYRETVILTKSGTQADPIRIRAYPGDEGKIIINAAESVTNWRKCASPADCDGNPYWDHIYVADVSALVWSHPDSEFAVRQVFQHGQLLKRSRYPDEGWHYPSEISDPKKTFTDNTLSKPDGYFVGSVCHIQTGMARIDQIPITRFNQGSVTLEKDSWYNISARFGYYITSIVGEINEEGEWAYDPARKKIFLWPKGDAAEGVEFTYRDFCVRTYDGVGWNVVRGLTMRNPQRYGIFLYRAYNMMIENNTIEHAFSFGIQLQSTGGFCNDNQIVRNTIRYSGYRGINVGSEAHRCNVEGNYVYATGVEHFGGDLMHGPSEGVYIVGPSARVYNNRIDRVGNVGLYLHGVACGRDISYNLITNTGLALSDTGGIYTAEFYEGREVDHIHHNIIVDSFGCRAMDRDHEKGLPVTIEKYSGGSSGIYVDEEGNNRIIEHNTVINSHMAGIFFHWAPGNVVRNNTLYGNRVAQIWFIGRDEPYNKLVDEIVLDNIMFATDAQQKTFYLGINYDDVHFGQSDRNYFYNPYHTSHIFISRYTGEWIQDDVTLQRWRALSGYDANSKEFSYLDQFRDITINTRTDPRIVYNPSLEVVSIDLESEKYCDVDGNKIYGSVSLQPFESKILIPYNFEIP